MAKLQTPSHEEDSLKESISEADKETVFRFDHYDRITTSFIL